MASTVNAGFATLTEDETAELLELHPELRDTRTASTGAATQPVLLAVTARDAREAAQLIDLVAAARSALVHQKQAWRDVVAALLPPGRLTLSAAMVAQAHRNAESRVALADEFGLLHADDVARSAGMVTEDAAAQVDQWHSAGRIFAVAVDGDGLFPGFQFDHEGKPLPVVRDIVQVLTPGLTPWELALWFTSANGYLGGVRPADALVSDPTQVRDAAEQLAREILV